MCNCYDCDCGPNCNCSTDYNCGCGCADRYRCRCDKKQGLRCGCDNGCGKGKHGYGKQFCKCGCKICEKPCKFGDCGPPIRLDKKCISTYRILQEIERDSVKRCH